MSATSLLERRSLGSRPFARRRSTGAKYVLPTGLAAGAVGAVGAQNPLAGVGVTGVMILSIIPWTALFVALAGSAVANRWGVEVSGASLRVAQAVMVPFAIRAVMFTTPELRPRWRAPEYLIIAFVGVNFLSTYFFSLDRTSELAALIELLGAVTYLAVYMSVVTPRRLRTAARIFLFIGAMDGLIGILSFLGYYVGFGFGVDRRYVPAFNGAPAIKGIAYEHDIFGSTCGAIAIAFLVLSRENGTLFSPKWTERFMWLSLGGMIVSQARGAWIGFTLVFIAYYVVGVRRRRVVRRAKMIRSMTIAMFVGLLALGALILTGEQTAGLAPSAVEGLVVTGTQKVASALNLSGTATCDGCNTGAGRLRRWTKGLDEVMANSPIIGLGTDSYGLRNFRPSPFTWPYLAPAYIESLYVRTLYDTGFLGLILLLSFFGILLWPRKELQHSPGDLAPLARALNFGALTLLLAYAVTDSTLLVWPWIMFGLTRAAMVLATRQARALRANGGDGGGPVPPGRPDLAPAAAAAVAAPASSPRLAAGPTWETWGAGNGSSRSPNP